MKLVLKKDVEKLGLVGDLVEVKEGYARNYLLPQNIAVTPTPANIKGIKAARAKAAELRQLKLEELKHAADRMAGVEITIAAAANEEGGLYGSVGAREIASALRSEGHTVESEQIQLHAPIRHLDNILVPVRFTDDIIVEAKVWVVREAASIRLDADEGQPADTEASEDDSIVDTTEQD